MKSIRRFLPVYLLDLSALEGWLEAMAGKGLHLESFGRSMATFRRGAPAQVRYRLEPMAAKDAYPGVERLTAYTQSGWSYVGDGGELYHIYRTDDPDAPELYTDPATQDYMLSILDRRNRQEHILYIAALLLNLFNLWNALSSLPYRPWKAMDVILLLVMLSIAVLLPYRFWWFHRLRSRLQAGIPLDHGRHWRRARLLYRALMVFVTAPLVMTFYVLFFL